ncbi:hypothetical protein P256_00641 [Acinetobacter nectaris CIP 110549]|uniref:DUF2474 domain-containing protein n=1 Tax=Acinetobacter nectaris CIP 110549 TaxID=1392540 RepID=V2TVA7_9GAMM|nr:hypothetical protein P256_00641 [Acinetobacter nectaris CIP 110549]
MKGSQIKWFVLLWLGGILVLAVIAGLFKGLLMLAY